jgi:hypothetical protein
METMNEPLRMSGGEESPPKKKNQFVILVISLFVLAAWIWVLNWLFTRFMSASYLQWFLKNGGLISITTAFFALVWKKIGEQEGLLAWHPMRFLASCFRTAGVFFMALGVNLGGPLDGVNRREADSVFIVEVLWDSWFSIVMDVFMMLAVLGWLLIVAPGFYLLTLFTGAPARREIRGTGRKLMVKTEENLTTITNQPTSMEEPSGAIDVSFSTQPFVLTNALNAAALMVLNLVLARMH